MRNFIINLKSSKAKSYIIKFFAVLFWIMVWHLASVIINREILLVSPFIVFKRIFQLIWQKSFYLVVFRSLINILLGFFMGMVLGILFAGLSYKFSIIKIFIAPLSSFIKAVPVASIIILCLIYVEAKNLSIFVSFLIVFPVYYFNLIEGLDNIDKNLVQMANVYKVGWTKKMAYVYIFQVYPYFVSASKIALGLCWKSGTAAEVIGMPKNTIGEKLYNAKIFFNTIDLFAWTLIIIIISTLFEKLFMKLFNMAVDKIERM